jgi:hypothetical protein
MKRKMDRYMWENQRMTAEKVKEAREDFFHNLDLVEAAFGMHAFRRWVPEKSLWRQQIIAALFDAEMFACRGLQEDLLRSKQVDIIKKMKKLFNDVEFRRTIDAATNTPTSFRDRIKIVRQMLIETIAQ